MDNLTPEQRKKNMQNIRSEKTKPEVTVFNELVSKGYIIETNAKDLPGKPDIIFREKKIAIFIDSDFWHGHPTRMIMPKSNVQYWENKLKRNIDRDKNVNKALKKMGWKVIRIWVYDLKKNYSKTMKKLIGKIEKI